MKASRSAAIAVGLVLGSLLWSGSWVVAQTKAAQAEADSATSLTVANKRYDAAKELDRLTRRYGLTDAQKANIQPLLLDQQKQVHALGEDQSLSDSAWANMVKRVHADTVDKVKHEMTDAQATKYAKDEAKSLKESKDSDNGDDFGPPDGGPPDGGPPPGGGGPGGGGPPMD